MPARSSALLLASILFLAPELAHASLRHGVHHHRRARSWGRAALLGPRPVPVVRGPGTPPPAHAAPPRAEAPTRPTLAQRLAQKPVLHELAQARAEWNRFNGE